MLRSLIIGAAAIAAVSATAPKARAEIIYPWCAIMVDESGDSTNCGFTSFAQCQVYISGIGGFCQENPFYIEAQRRPPRRPYRPRH